MLYKAKIGGKEAYIYFLFEHKSYIVPHIALQLLKYMLAIWEQKRNKEKAQKLPVIIPLLVYHVDSGWEVDNKFSSLIKEIDELPMVVQKYIPDYEADFCCYLGVW